MVSVEIFVQMEVGILGRGLERLPSCVGYFAVVRSSIWTWHLQSSTAVEKAAEGHYLIQQKAHCQKAFLWGQNLLDFRGN